LRELSLLLETTIFCDDAFRSYSSFPPLIPTKTSKSEFRNQVRKKYKNSMYISYMYYVVNNSNSANNICAKIVDIFDKQNIS
jgi:hypothetical protein